MFVEQPEPGGQEHVSGLIEEGLDKLFKAELFMLIYGFLVVLALMVAFFSAFESAKSVQDFLVSLVSTLRGFAVVESLVSLVYAYIMYQGFAALGEALDPELVLRGKLLLAAVVAHALLTLLIWNLVDIDSLAEIAMLNILMTIVALLAGLVWLWAYWPLGSLQPGGEVLKIGLLLRYIGLLPVGAVKILGFVGELMVLYALYRMRNAAFTGELRETPML